MKILLAQIDTFVGDVEGNARRVLEMIEKGRARGADLVIFPELTLLGYPPRDLVLQNSLIGENIAALERIAAKTGKTGAIVGFVDRNPSNEGKGLFNAAALIADGKILSKHYKSLLPTYDVFDEGRYFDPAPGVSVAEFRGKRIAVTICEDIWNFDPGDGGRRLYNSNPVDSLSKQNPDLIVNISASPFTLGKRKIREQVIGETLKICPVPLVHVNLVGGNDSIIFDGWSAAFDKEGKLLARTSDFCEDCVLFDLDSMKGQIHPETAPGPERLLEALKLGLADYVKKCGFEKCVLGLSGGIDSALVAAVAAFALGAENVEAVCMPSRFSSKGSLDDAARLAKNLGIRLKTISIEEPFSSFLELMKPLFGDLPFDVAEENIQARIRGVILMALSNKFGWLVLSTGNKSELAMGYCTLYGDMTGGLAVISDVPKTLVYELASYINRERELIPRSIIQKPPSAELRPDQKDEDSLPPYDVLDPVIRAFVEERRDLGEIAESNGLDPEFVRGILGKLAKSEYKRRQAAPGLKLTGRAFGEGWRMPIAAAWGKKK